MQENINKSSQEKYFDNIPTISLSSFINNYTFLEKYEYKEEINDYSKEDLEKLMKNLNWNY